MIRPAWALLVIASATPGCAWVTDLGTNGYKVASCNSSAECESGICCVTSLSPVTSVCQASCSSLSIIDASVPVCASNEECTEGACVPQTCLGTPVSACGRIDMCTASEATLDASVVLDTAVPTTPSIDASLAD